jgi:hypothetical protein
VFDPLARFLNQLHDPSVRLQVSSRVNDSSCMPRNDLKETDEELELLPEELADGTPAYLPLDSMLDLLTWYRRNLCFCEIRDPRGYKVLFPEPEFVHLIKLASKHNVEPRNRRLTIQQIDSGRVQLVSGRFSVRRARELSWARLIVVDPWKILPNWQVMGIANPGEVYIRNFGTEKKPVMRSLVCGLTGQTRRVVTHFPRGHFSKQMLATAVWP